MPEKNFYKSSLKTDLDFGEYLEFIALKIHHFLDAKGIVAKAYSL